MIEPPSIAAAWSSLFLGLFAFAAALGELRRPGGWRRMMQELGTAPALQLIIGLLELALGTLIYIVNPWNSGDWLALVMKTLGAVMMLEALLICALADRFLHIWTRILERGSRGWAAFSLVLGLVLIFAATYRFYLTTPY